MSERLVRGARRCGETFYHFTDEAKALLSVQSGRDYNRRFLRDILLRWYRVWYRYRQKQNEQHEGTRVVSSG